MGSPRHIFTPSRTSFRSMFIFRFYTDTQWHRQTDGQTDRRTDTQTPAKTIPASLSTASAQVKTDHLKTRKDNIVIALKQQISLSQDS